MNVPTRRTVVVPDRLALRAHRLRAARAQQHGLQVVTIEQLAARLAGGFVRPIDADSLRVAIQAVLPLAPLGELEAIKSLPGMVNAAAGTLEKGWRAGIDLQARADAHPRLAALARLEQAVLAHLPAAMERPAGIAAAAIARLAHAPAVLGSVDLDGMSDIAPCWRVLLLALATQVPVRWRAGPRAVPEWVEDSAVEVVPGLPATPAHEALEAMRWMRALLASRQALPHEIAIASADPARFDAHLLALREEAGIDLHFVHGVPVATTRDGQAAAALADTLVHGLSQLRLRRLATLCADAPLLRALPDRWLRVLPPGAALASPQAWERLLARIAPADWPEGTDHDAALAALAVLVGLLQRGADAAEEAGEQLLRGRALSLWRRALVAGPAASLPATIERMKQDDGLDPCATVAWMPAAALAGTPRRFVRLLGLNAGQWPRASAEDGLLPDHVVAAEELEWLTRAEQDCRDFGNVRRACATQVVLSFSRRNDDGRKLSRSALLAGLSQSAYLLRHAAAPHAMSEADRLAARLPEFRCLPLARTAATCWSNWQDSAVTAHDGEVRPGHPLLQAIADRTHSASSLKRLLRNPIGYMWEYGLGWNAPELVAEQLTLDAAASGNLVHEILDLALQRLEADGGLSQANAGQVTAALDAASAVAAANWAAQAELPPAAIWRHTLAQARQLGFAALTMNVVPSPAGRAYGEVAFGGARPKAGAQPWDPAAQVEIPIPGGALRIAGYIDRLDISPDGQQVLVRDYKTGKPVDKTAVLDGGAEVQRCLYAYAAKAMLGQHVHVRTTLMYPRDRIEFELADPDAAMAELAAYLGNAYQSLVAGHCLPGPDTGGGYDKFAFLLPANAQGAYCKRKYAAIKTMLGDAAKVWEST
jgi:hypothetical protein